MSNNIQPEDSRAGLLRLLFRLNKETKDKLMTTMTKSRKGKLLIIDMNGHVSRLSLKSQKLLDLACKSL